MEGDLPTFVLRLAGLVVALFIMYALTESRFGRATTFVAFVGGVALIALGNFAVFSLAGPETFLRFYPLTGNVAAFALLLGIARQRPLVVAFTILTAIQLNAVIGMLGPCVRSSPCRWYGRRFASSGRTIWRPRARCGADGGFCA